GLRRFVWRYRAGGACASSEICHTTPATRRRVTIALQSRVDRGPAAPSALHASASVSHGSAAGAYKPLLIWIACPRAIAAAARYAVDISEEIGGCESDLRHEHHP